MNAIPTPTSWRPRFFARSATPAMLVLAAGVALYCQVTCKVRAQDAAETFALDPSLPYRAQRLEPVSYEVDFSVVVTPPYKTKQLRVWLPVPPSDTAQHVTGSQFSTFPDRVEPQIAVEPEYQNRFAHFEFDSPQGAQIVRHRFRIKVWELCWDVDPGRISAVSDWPSEFDKYRRGDSQAVIVDDRFHQVLDEILPERASPFTGLRGVMDWVQTNFEYDHAAASLSANAEHALLKRRGHCSDYHSFCASLGRILGVPTRVTYGINTFPKNSPSHCKLEAFLAPYGWVSFDVSETQRLIAAIRESPALDEKSRERLIQAAQSRLLRGFRDNTWFLQTRGTDYELVPRASRRVAVVRTAYIEADGVPLPEPDPANKSQNAFTWMTVHSYRPDRNVTYPFADWTTLRAAAVGE